MKRHLKEDFNAASRMVRRLRSNRKYISDGNHTFDELYQHRTALLLALMRECNNKNKCWIAEYHSDGSMFDDDLFIAGIGLENGKQITYHVKKNWWTDFSKYAKVYTYAPVEWDGHTSEDVISRLVGGEY